MRRADRKALLEALQAHQQDARNHMAGPRGGIKNYWEGAAIAYGLATALVCKATGGHAFTGKPDSFGVKRCAWCGTPEDEGGQ